MNGGYGPTGDLLAEGAPPELLFVERCLDWLAPGGILGMVLPKSFLDTTTYRPGRELLFRQAKVLAVINLHKDTFQPNTGTRTCVIVAQKLKDGENSGNYSIFMAISRRIGQNSEGSPVYKHDALNNLTDEIDEDVGGILDDYERFKLGSLVNSQYVFSIKSSEIDSRRRINPQLFLPHLNETIKQIESIDGLAGWTTIALDQLDTNIKIFKGPRLKSETLIVEGPGRGIEPYYTPSAMLQEKGDSAKWLNVGRADRKQLATIDAIRVRKGDIVISRSGTIGRVAIITDKHDGAIVSDDLIRVRTNDLQKRAFLFTYLQSRYAQDQMSRNEYGAIQQHLEPQHIRDILIPWPEDTERLNDIIELADKTVVAREELDSLNRSLVDDTATLIDGLIASASDATESS